MRRLSYERRQVVLSSGKQSDFYIDCKQTALTAEGHALIGRVFVERLGKLDPPVVAAGGLTLGADPIASAVALTSFLAGHPIDAFIIRKEPKGHGTAAWIEGRKAISDGARVAILEDVITTGASTLKAVERARESGLLPVCVLALVDRGEGGVDAVRATGIEVDALFTASDFTGGAP